LKSKRYSVEFTKFAAKQIERLPKEIREATHFWAVAVETLGLPETQKSKGYHDEMLKGSRKGQRSIRLNRAYRLIYRRTEYETVVIVGVLEVNKHDY
jgi:proteic killer suppression protein